MEVQVWPRARWTRVRDRHTDRARQVLDPVIERRRTGQRHPIEDFLFDYYRLRPGDLLEWNPGVGVVLADADEFAARRWYRRHEGGWTVDVPALLQRRRPTIEFTHRLLSGIDSRPAQFGCFGMHEWAMVHGLTQDQVRHVGLPLRFSPQRTAEIVEQSGVRCSHFDAFRFFTDSARGLNSVQLTRDDQLTHDQAGCLHVGMDLYKWAGKLHPLTSSELLLDCYLLARDIRLLDMRASAYDVSSLGHSPVPVETAAGRADYAAQQRAFAERAAPLRSSLRTLTSHLLAQQR